MKKFHRFITATVMMALLSSMSTLKADDEECGECYEQSSCCRKLRPEWALGGLAIVAIVAVCLQKNDGGHSH